MVRPPNRVITQGPKLSQAALARTRDTARRACDYGPAPYGVTVQSAAPSSFHASASIPSHISCRCNLDVSRCISLYLVVSFSLSTSLYVAVFLVLLVLTLSVSFLEVTLAIDELRGLRLLLLTLSFLEVLALAKDELNGRAAPSSDPPPLPGLRGGTWGAKGGPLR